MRTLGLCSSNKVCLTWLRHPICFGLQSSSKLKATSYPKYKRRDIVAEGSGFLQWLSVFALAADSEIDVLLLDEADVHLHPSLQGRMLFRLNREAVSKGKQVLYVTHSTEVLRSSAYHSIYYIAEKGKGYLAEESGKVKAIEGLGSLYLS